MTDIVKLPTEAVWVLGFYNPHDFDGHPGKHQLFPWPIDGVYSSEEVKRRHSLNYPGVYPDNVQLVQCPLDNLYEIGNSWFDIDCDDIPGFVAYGWRIHKKDKNAVIHGWNWNKLKLGTNVGEHFKIYKDHHQVPLPKDKWLPFKVLRPKQISEAAYHFHRHRRVQPWNFPVEPMSAGTFVFESGINPIAPNYIKEHVINGILETVETIFHHWEHHAEMGDRYNPELINNEQNREKITQLNQSDAQVPKRNAEIARIEYLEIKDDLKKNFEKANTLTQTLAVCARYLEGEFGEDWHVRGYWNPERSPWHYQSEKKRLDEQHNLQHLHRMGFIDNHFESSALKPLFKRFPKLARLYGIPTEGVSSKPKKTVIVDGTDWKTVKPTG